MLRTLSAPMQGGICAIQEDILRGRNVEHEGRPFSSTENLEAMMEAVSMVKTGQVTYAVRDTRLDEKEIHEGDIMGIGDHGILAVGKGRENVAKEMVAAMVDEDSEVISIYYGAETTEEDAESLAAELEEAYPDCEVEVNMGGQPIYYYIISVE